MNAEVKKEIINHLIASLIIFVLVEIIWLLGGNFSFLKAGLFLLGLALGTFLLDTDHLIYWFFLKPELGESKQAKIFWQQRNWRGLFKFLGEDHKNHTSLVFHHFIFQAVLLTLAFFVLSSTSGIFGKGLVLALSAHLLVDQLVDLRKKPDHLKTWLFARTSFADLPLPSSWLWSYWLFYLVILGGIISVFIR